MSEWISVSDRLPEPFLTVAILLFDQDGFDGFRDAPTAGYRVRDSNGENAWLAGVPGRYFPPSADGWTVTHWAELPELPEVEG